jgi:6-phosphofructokinase 1
MTTVRRIAVLTGGGDAPGLNAVLFGLITRAEALGIECLASEDGYEGLIKGKLMPIDATRVRGIASHGGSLIGCSNRANPFAYPRRDEEGKVSTEDVSERVAWTVRNEQIDFVVAIGGDGTMAMTSRLAPLGVKSIGVPKTIDNDLAATDVTFGFQSAVDFATLAVDRIHTTAAAHDRVMIIEVMGRYAGWIALEAGLAGGANVIVLPEFEYDVQRIADAIHKRHRAGLNYSIIVISEGAKPVGGTHAITKDMPAGHLPKLGGAGERLAKSLEPLVPEHEIRVTVLGHVQRGGSPVAFDRVLGIRMGVAAAEAVAKGEAGVMVSLRDGKIVTVPMSDAVGKNRNVTAMDERVLAARAVGVEFGVDFNS